jgi:hypothetical protein
MNWVSKLLLFTWVLVVSACGGQSPSSLTNQLPEAAAPAGDDSAVSAPPAADGSILGVETGADASSNTPPASDAPSGGPPVADVSQPPADAGQPPAEAGGTSEIYACTLIIGINATAEWYYAGFQALVDKTKWEIIQVHSGFVELWANPSDPVWSTPIATPCAKNPNSPDRVIFVALNFNFTTLAQWLPPLTASVKNIQAKYTGLRRIDLMTFVRAPGNMACPQMPAPRSTIVQAEDDAIAMVAQANPNVVRVAPKFEAKSCNEFTNNPPHPTPAGGMAWAQMIAQYYGLGK